MKTIAIYTRKSKATNKGESIENQINLCKNYISKIFLEDEVKIEIYNEGEGFSGGDSTRKKFNELIQDAKKGKYNVLICYRLDRVARSVADFSDLIEELNRNNISFISVKEQFDTTTPMGRAMMYIASVFAQLEREIGAERIRDNMRELAKTGRWLGGTTPTGYESVGFELMNVKEYNENNEVVTKVKKAFMLKKIDEEIYTVKTLFQKFLNLKSLTALETYALNNNIKTKNNTKNNKVLFIIFLILSIILMYVSMGHMIGLPTFEFLNMHTHPISYAITLLIITIPFIFYGFDIIKSGFKNLIHKSPNMDTLVAIGVLSSLLYSLYNMYIIIKGNTSYVEHLYFESAAIVIFFIKLGRYIDGASKDKTKEAIQKLVQITPKDATIKVNGDEKKVTIDEINKGDIVISKPGERISVDGEIVIGKTHLDESFITGESKPVAKNIGDKVIAGSINYDGYIEYKAEKIGKESTISEIVKLVIEATNTKAPIAKIADTVSGYFVPTVIIIAFITFFSSFINLLFFFNFII